MIRSYCKIHPLTTIALGVPQVEDTIDGTGYAAVLYMLGEHGCNFSRSKPDVWRRFSG
jgi:hypothetical protein